MGTLSNFYNPDRTDTEWEQWEALVPPAKAGGRPPKHSRREILNGIFYAAWPGNSSAFCLALRSLLLPGRNKFLVLS
jgi:transposase